MFKARFVLVSLAAVFSFAAFAGDNSHQGKSFTVSWDEFKARCADADSFDNQRLPKEIKVQCTNIEREFVPSAPGTVDLGAARQVVTAVLSDKFNVANMERAYALSTQPGSCLRYKEIQKSFTVEHPLTCNDILTMKGDANDYCLSSLDQVKGSNPKLIDVKETGNVRDTCGGADQGGKK